MKTKILVTMILIESVMLSFCFAETVSTQKISNQSNTILWVDSNETSVLKKNDKVQRQTIAKVMPDEFNNYEKQLKNDFGMSDAKLSLSLVSRAYDLRKNNSDPNKQEDFNKTYRSVWLLTTGVMQKTKNPEVKKLIMDNWNSYLKKDDMSVPYQIYALAYEGRDPNRSFFTEEFWKLLEKTKNKKTISAIGLVVYQGGNREDYKRLEDKKRDSGIDKESQYIIDVALSYMRQRLSGKPWPDPGIPSFKPPQMNFIDDYQEPNSKYLKK